MSGINYYAILPLYLDMYDVCALVHESLAVEKWQFSNCSDLLSDADGTCSGIVLFGPILIRKKKKKNSAELKK